MSKNKFVTAGLAQLVKILVGGKLFKEIYGLVKVHLDDNISGIAKKESVTREINDVRHQLFSIVHSMSGWAVSVAIDVAYAYIASRQDDK